MNKICIFFNNAFPCNICLFQNFASTSQFCVMTSLNFDHFWGGVELCIGAFHQTNIVQFGNTVSLQSALMLVKSSNRIKKFLKR